MGQIIMMKTIILGIETSTDACSVAIFTSQKIFSTQVLQPQAHSKLLIGMIDEILKEAAIELSEVSAFAFGSGPGSFTGVRIAASVIQGLAFGTNKPTIAISSLQAMAQQAFNKLGNKNIVVLADAKMQEIYCGFYRINEQNLAEAISPDALLKPEQIVVKDPKQYIAVGSAIVPYETIIVGNNPDLVLDESIEHPYAQEIVQLAAVQFAKGNMMDAKHATPTYLRNDVAKKKDKKNPD